MIAWTLFYHPMTLNSRNLLWLLLPLCASVAIIYKTIRTNNLRDLPREATLLVVYMALGLVTLGAVLWLIQDYWP